MQPKATKGKQVTKIASSWALLGTIQECHLTLIRQHSFGVVLKASPPLREYQVVLQKQSSKWCERHLQRSF